MEQTTITLASGFQMNARVWGPKDGRPVLALHGWMDNAATFDRLAPLLPGVRLVAIDLPGHGFSQHLPQGSHHAIYDAIPYVMAVADQLHWQHFSVLGHSMGGGIGQVLAAVYPERVEALICLDIFGVFIAEANTIVDQLRAYCSEYFKSYKPNRCYQSLDEAALVRQQNSDMSLESASILAAGGMVKADGGYVWGFDPDIRKRSIIRLTDDQLDAILSGISVNFHAVFAEHGFVAQHPALSRHFDRVANLTVHPVPGGHHVHLDDPQPTADIITSVLVDAQHR